MKLTALSKSVRSIGMMVLLSAIVGTPLQQSAQAQTKVLPPVPTIANSTCVPLPEGGFFFELQGIKLSPKQEAAYRQILAKMNVRDQAHLQRIRKDEANGDLATEIKEGVEDKTFEEIQNAATAVSRDRIPDAKQVEELTEKYGQYATFSISPRLLFTSEQIAERDKMTRDQEDQTLSILTPNQQKVYRANLVRKRQLEACK